jgi:hypothetical protein
MLGFIIYPIYFLLRSELYIVQARRVDMFTITIHIFMSSEEDWRESWILYLGWSS